MPNTIQPVILSAAKTLTRKGASGGMFVFGSTTGFAITLPTSTGAGDVYRFVIGTAATSGSHSIKVGNATDVFDGSINLQQDTDTDGTVKGWRADVGDDTLSFAGAATTGGIAGGYIEIWDYKAGFFTVMAYTQSGGGSEATPFSAGV
jgi:hypothetical protein